MTTVFVIVAIADCIVAIIFFACVAVSVEVEPQGEPIVCQLTGNMCNGNAPCSTCLIWQDYEVGKNREKFRVIENENGKGH